MFTIDDAADSDSGESDIEIPKFFVSSFEKYPTTKSTISNSPEKDYHNKRITLSSSIDAGEEYDKHLKTEFSFKSLKHQMALEKEMLKKKLDENIKKSVLSQPGFFSDAAVPPMLSARQAKKLRKKENAKTKGPQWFNMPAAEMTEEKKNDLMVLKMRQALNPKQFYKRSAKTTNTKFFQVGTYVDSPVDFYSSRVPKKQRKQTLVDELMADAQFRQYQKKKYKEIEYTKPRVKFHKKKPSNRKPNKTKAAKVKKGNKKDKSEKKK